MHFVSQLVFVECVRGEADLQTREEKGHFPVLQPDQPCSAPASLGRLWAVQHSTQTAPGPGGRPWLNSVPELVQVEKATKHLRSKV